MDMNVIPPGERPPYSAEAELGVIGAFLHDAPKAKKVITKSGFKMPETEWFFVPSHQIIWECIQTLTACDAVTVADALKKANSFDQAGGWKTLNAAMDNTVVVAHVAHYVEIIREKHMLRKLIQSASTARLKASNGDTPPDNLIAQLLSDIKGMKSSPRRRMSIDEAADASFKEMLLAKTTGHRGIRVKWSKLQPIVSLRRGKASIICAIPGVGKTTFICDLILDLATRIPNPIPSGFISLEENEQDLVEKWIPNLMTIDIGKMNEGDFGEAETANWEHGKRRLRVLPIHYSCGPKNIDEVLVAMQDFVVDHDAKIIFLDYLQLIRSERKNKQTRNEEVAGWSNAIVNMASELDVHIMMASQLNRAVEKRPQMKHLRDSGAIEQDAEVIISLYPDPDEPEEWGDNTPIIAEVLKHRKGRKGRCPLRRMGKFQRFNEDHREQEDLIEE